MTRSWLFVPLALLLAFVTACGGSGPSQPASTSDAPEAGAADSPQTEDSVVNVYSARHYDTDDQVFGAFEEETGIKVHIVEGDSAALLERLRREGEESPADLFIAVDAGRLFHAEQAGIFDSVTSEILEERIPASLRHPEGLWFGLTKRARVIVYAKDRVEAGEINTYEDLADPKWQGRVLIRSSSNVYNQSLMGAMVAAHGEPAAEEWCKGLVANLARKPQGGDRDQVRAVAAGEGDVAVVNSYYLAQMIAATDKPEDQAAAAAVGIVFPNQGDRGTHVNISGAGVVRGAPHRQNAIRLLEYLTGADAQAIFAGGNKEYAVVDGYAAVPELEGFGEFQEDSVNASVFGSSGQQALRMMDRCGWR
ncbi:MAG: Fe(3+) ABC transporter substrate-binding protein [Thermoanaerobaculia bacterium]|nr:Fe(3+) ABC transporter substrate-binding protein [Thermoanaerobaculia bacterium]